MSIYLALSHKMGTRSKLELQFGNVKLVFEERGKSEYPEKNLSEQRRELPQTEETTHRRIWKEIKNVCAQTEPLFSNSYKS